MTVIGPECCLKFRDPTQYRAPVGRVVQVPILAVDSRMPLPNGDFYDLVWGRLEEVLGGGFDGDIHGYILCLLPSFRVP